MAAFRESKTAKNLLLSFSAEAQARTRYNFFATRAREEGYMQIANLFDETASQEYEHGLRFFKFFNGGELEITGTFPAGVIQDTKANLLSSAELELYTHDQMYGIFAQEAEREGLRRAADTFSAINVAEKNHELMFRDIAASLISGNVFMRDQPVIWKCISCGYLHEGKSPPDKCPACVKPPGYFKIFKKNW